MQKYIILEKLVGETPLSCAETYRAGHPELEGVPMAYAGRLDPMASGKLLILLGEECKNQTSYHGLDKEYEFSVLLGIGSDSLDVLGRLTTNNTAVNCGIVAEICESVTQYFIGKVKLPYPRFSSKTVQGKPLHMWTMEGRLSEIEIPTKESEIFELEFTKLEILSKKEVVHQALEKVNSVPPVTELRKALGNDFRRVDVRKDWDDILHDDSLPKTYQIIHFRCVASSGTYMRTLASEIAKKLGTVGLAWHIHRTKIGEFVYLKKSWTHLF
ncbi:hypothetical protein H6785_00230 [Candidatus Nomurabacteria bacterium]|nr:hypothetical protein [Candidatus Kaiserbacteria bacterium]MCB9814999.1 hypothetical protein [Candidatus Nomurabacteria bacterium]